MRSRRLVDAGRICISTISAGFPSQQLLCIVRNADKSGVRAAKVQGYPDFAQGAWPVLENEGIAKGLVCRGFAMFLHISLMNCYGC